MLTFTADYWMSCLGCPENCQLSFQQYLVCPVGLSAGVEPTGTQSELWKAVSAASNYWQELCSTTHLVT